MLVVEDCDEGGVVSSSSSEALRFLEGVEGSDGGGVGRLRSGTILYKPSLDRKSGMPQLVLMPAPVMTTILCDGTSRSAMSWSSRSFPIWISCIGMSEVRACG